MTHLKRTVLLTMMQATAGLLLRPRTAVAGPECDNAHCDGPFHCVFGTANNCDLDEESCYQVRC